MSEPTAAEPTESVADILNDFCGILNDSQREHIEKRITATTAQLRADLSAANAHLDAIGNTCGFPVVENKAQLADTIIKRVNRVDADLSAAREDSARLDWILANMLVSGRSYGDTRRAFLAVPVPANAYQNEVTRSVIDAARKTTP